MKLLDAVKELRIDNLSLMNRVYNTLENRLDWLSDREPESYGIVYDVWSEKYENLQEIIDIFEEFKDETDIEKKEDLIEEIQNGIENYQFTYGGLSRLKI